MNLFKHLLTVGLIALFSINANAQRAKEGDVTVSSPNTIVNSYTYLTSDISTGNTSIPVFNSNMNGGAFSGNLAPGDLILIIQMQGAGVDIADIIGCCGGSSASSFSDFWSWWLIYDLFGSVTQYRQSGKFEMAEVASVPNGTTINLQCGLKNDYSSSQHAQIVRVPRYNNLAVTGGVNSIIPSQWGGNSGGVVAIEVDGNLNIASGSSISASGFGFRGGELDPDGLPGNTTSPTEKRFPGTNDSFQGSEKGESIHGYHAEYDSRNTRYGIGAAANGGGGGGYQNCGGGGGSNISPTIAGFSGKGVPTGTAATWNLENPPIGGTSSPGGGRGGYAYSTSNQNELSMGPENGSWGGDSRKNNGGLGGHPLSYDATRLFFGGGGGAGDQDSDQGGAGGNGGGLVYIKSFGTITGSGTIEANGADGQNTNPNNLPVNFGNLRRGNDGAGGAGGGGAIYIENAAALPGTMNLLAEGGKGGDQNLSLASGQSPEAGGPGGGGGGGSIAFNGAAPIQSVAGGANGTTNSAHVNNFPQNGATAGNVGISGLASKYYDLTISDVTICENTDTDLIVTILGSLPSGSTVQWYDAQFGYDATPLGSGTTYNTGSLSSTTTYYIGLCPGPTTFRIPVTVTVTPEDNPDFTATASCPGNSPTITATVTGLAGGTFSFNVAPGDGATIDASTGAVSNAVAGTSYDILYTTIGTCPTTLVQSALVACPLPIELLSFDAQLNSQRIVDLTWITASELNNDYFTIERSSEGNNWNELSEIDGAGTSTTTLNYFDQDRNPIIGTTYYRLKQTDFNGYYTYSDIRAVSIDVTNEIRIYPNPTSNIFQIEGSVDELSVVMIFDGLGRDITGEMTITKLSENQFKIDSSELANGVYSIRTKTQTNRLIKQ